MFCKLSAIENISLSYARTYKTEFLKIKKNVFNKHFRNDTERFNDHRMKRN